MYSAIALCKQPMKSFELQVNQKTYKIIKLLTAKATYSVFNYSSFYTIAKIDTDRWEVVEHRFGDQEIPLQQIGQGIDNYIGLQSGAFTA